MNPHTVVVADGETANQAACVQYLRMMQTWGIDAAEDPRSYSVSLHCINRGYRHSLTRDQWLAIELMHAVPNQAHLAGGGLAWNRLQAVGARAGVPDLIVPGSRLRSPLAIEFKSAKGVASPAQKIYASCWIESGGAYSIQVHWRDAVTFILTHIGVLYDCR